jgi:hypothetical protein
MYQQRGIFNNPTYQSINQSVRGYRYVFGTGSGFGTYFTGTGTVSFFRTGVNHSNNDFR